MLFVSNGAQLLEKKIEFARRRMFLFSNDVPLPNDKSSFSDMWGKINQSLSFCAAVDVDNNMQCVRGAGWSDNKLFYNHVPGVNKDSEFSTTNQTRNLSAFDVFCRYYAIGKDDTGGGALNGSGSLLNTYGTSAPTVPAYFDMVLPSFDNTSYTARLYSVPDTSASVTASDGGSIGSTGRWSRSTTSSLMSVGLNSVNMDDDKAILVSYTVAMTPIYAGQSYDHSMPAFGRAPIIFQPYRTVVYGTYYFSGGGWNYSTSYSAGSYGQSGVGDNPYYFGVGTHEDTPAYSIAWGAMPIAFAYGAPIYVVISKANEDFVQTGQAGPNVKPEMVLTPATSVVISKAYNV